MSLSLALPLALSLWYFKPYFTHEFIRLSLNKMNGSQTGIEEAKEKKKKKKKQQQYDY
jgi:hypothetical protein